VKSIAVAIVLAAILAGVIIGDMGLMAAKDAEAWNTFAGYGFIVFGIVLLFGRSE
jgi:uncharacterized membrane protein YdcZ (DUF606 family)